MFRRFMIAVVFAAIVPIFAASASSQVGYSWARATPAAPWVERCQFATVAFNNRLWVIGGDHDMYLDEYPLNDVWSSADGVNWFCVTAHAAWTPRYGHTVTVFNGKMWLVGGTAPASEIWSSSDGSDWTLVTSTAPLSDWQPAITFSNRLWLVGGQVSGTFDQPSEVWYSSNAVDWTLATANPPWENRSGHGICASDERMWLFGGLTYDTSCPYGACYLNDAWWTENGVTWTQATADAGWPLRRDLASSAFDGNLWVVGGLYWGGSPHGGTLFYADTWRTPDGSNWVKVSDGPWQGRSGHTTAAFNGRLWLLGGDTSGASPSKNDVWYLSPVTAAIIGDSGQWYQVGQSLKLRLPVAGISGPISYQWTTDGTAIPDATTDAFEIDELAISDSGSYTCQISDQYNETFTADPLKVMVFPAGSLPVGEFLPPTVVLLLSLIGVMRLAKRRSVK